MTPRQFTAIFTLFYSIMSYLANVPLHGADWVYVGIGIAAAPIYAYNLATLLLKWKAMMPAMPWD